MEMQNQMGGRIPHMMQPGMMGQHPQMMGQTQTGVPGGQLMPGSQMQPHPNHPISHPGIQQNQAQPPPNPGPEQPKLDNISRAKALVPTLKELVSVNL